MAIASSVQSFIYTKKIDGIPIIISAFIGLAALHLYYKVDPHRGGGRGKISIK
jgi:hypothetical protein